MIAFDLLAILVALVVLAHAGWWVLLGLIALPPWRTTTASRPLAAPRIAVLVPAHNEEALLAATLHSVVAAADRRTTVLVIADNCSDATAEIARRAGVGVLERFDGSRRGKSYALDAGLQYLESLPTTPDVVVFIDADCVVSESFFREVSAAFADPSVQAVQAYYEPAAATAGLGRLRRLAFALLHYARPLGAARLGLPTTIKGTGMALRWEHVRDGFGAQGLAEDASLTLALARQGVSVTFLPGARVAGHMAQDYESAKTQDHRWERGRLGLMRRAIATGLRLLSQRRLRPAAAAFEVASLPLSLLVFMAATVLLAALLSIGRLDVAVSAWVALVAYVLVGAAAARVSPGELLALVTVPRFLLHKAGVYLRSILGGQLDWTRTRR